MFTSHLPPGFVYLSDVDPTIKFDIKYATNDNIVGRPLAGYLANKCICTREAALALKDLQQYLDCLDLELFIFDAYRPQKASQDFVNWAQRSSDQKNKADFYPKINKADLHRLHYILEHSQHSTGNTFDLTLRKKKTGEFLDMGTEFDFMDELSHPANRQVSPEVYKNRQFLQKLMESVGFEGIETEWWHFNRKGKASAPIHDFDIR